MDTQHGQRRPRRPGLISLSCFGLLLILLLAACGSVPGGGGASSGSNGGSSSTPTTVKGYGTTYGCPSDAVVNALTPANVTVKVSNTQKAITGHVGDVIEFQLPFGQRWTGPDGSQGNLEIQQPAGFAQKTAKVCVWRFVAKGTGETQLDFHGQALCKLGQMCPQYIIDLPFTVTIS